MDDACPSDATCSFHCYHHDCACDEGFVPTGDLMEDGECCMEDPCRDGGAEDCGPAEGTICTNECKGHTCSCEEGFTMTPTGEDTEECVLDCFEDTCANNMCGAGSQCVPGCYDYICECIPGFQEDCQDCFDPEDMLAAGTHPDFHPDGSKKEKKMSRKRRELEAGVETNLEASSISVPDDHVDTMGFTCPGCPLYDLICKIVDPCTQVDCVDNAECHIEIGDREDSAVCRCIEGYAMKDGECVEKVNECITGEHNCHEYATCHDELFGFHCTCNDKYKDISENGDGTDCTHPYYTEDGECYLTEYSIFTDKKFERVSYGTSYDHFSAVHYWNAITKQLSHLGEVAERTVQCATDAGIVGCALIDYTKDKTACDWAHTLETVVGKVAEKCNEDWTMMYNPYLAKLRKATCEEPDDCANDLHNCDPNATCTPKPARYGKKTSGFTCKCNAGFYGNGRHCHEEVDECVTGAHKCSLNASCKDISAGYKCYCNPGFVGNGYKCNVPVDECALGIHECSKYADCIDLDNGYTLGNSNKEGYVGNGKQCTGPADECQEGTHTCNTLTTDCVNTYAGFTCKCKEGFFGDPKKGCWPPLTCPWLEEYAADNYASYKGDFSNGLCSLKYSKVCTKSLFEGLYGNGMKVCNKNIAYSQFNLFMAELFAMGKTYEKKYGPATSHFATGSYDRYGAECSVESGAVPCQLINFHNIETVDDLWNRVNALFNHVFNLCDPVYKAKWEGWKARFYNALICPVNECKTGAYECHENAACVDRAIGYDCVCKKHYHGDGFEKCDMIDYCEDSALCGLFATCKNLEPGYECNCVEGYYHQRGKCVPADPCKTNNGGCDDNAACYSQIIGYEVNHQCKCKPGFYGNGFVCEPVDACAEHRCDENADCIPYAKVVTEADYNCKCKTGFEGNGFICTKFVDPCEGVSCKDGETTNVAVTSYGQKVCNCVCATGYHRVEGTCEIKDKCTITKCEEGYKCVNNGDCVPIPDDPCENCHYNAKCVEMGYPPAKQCVCKECDPWVGDGFACRAAKTCTKTCHAPTKCVDGKCGCPSKGLWYNWASKKCQDKNECLKNKQGQVLNNCHPQATCKNTYGGFTCTCPAGMAGDGVTCVEKKEEAYAAANPYAGPAMPSQAAFSGYDSMSPSSIDLYSNLGDGQCSLMGFEWANLDTMIAKMKWATNKVTNENYVRAIIKEFQNLGKAAIARAGPACNLEKAGVVDCNLLFFPHKEHRCQMIKRLYRIYQDVATECNTAWADKFGKMMNFLLQNNQSGKQGAPCETVEFL